MTTLPAGIPDKLTLRDIGCRAVTVPPVFTLGTSAAIVRAVPSLLVDLATDEGPVGRTYLFCYTGSGARAIAEHIVRLPISFAERPRRPSRRRSFCSGASRFSA